MGSAPAAAWWRAPLSWWAGVLVELRRSILPRCAPPSAAVLGQGADTGGKGGRASALPEGLRTRIVFGKLGAGG